MRFVLLSDTHSRHEKVSVPPGDVLVHAGDLTMRGTLPELHAAFQWIGHLPHRHKIVIAGNHDFALQDDVVAAEALIPPGVTYLRDSGVSIDGVMVWGSPWQPWFNDWAFNLQRGPEIAARWDLIPSDVNLLITHGPPYGTLDRVAGPPMDRVGCEMLAARIGQLGALRLHVFGHVHEDHGVVAHDGWLSVNASICDLTYRPSRAPVVVEFEDGRAREVAL